MSTVLAAEGGYQEFVLGTAEWAWLIISAVTALVALGVGFLLSKGVLRADQGTEKMKEIAAAIQEGAMAYLRRQFKTILVILIPLVVVVYLTSTEVLAPDGSVALSFVESGLFRTIAFVAGCFLSGLTGFIGMSLAVRGNVRTAAAAKSGSLPAALKVAFRTGGVAGMFTVGLGLLGATLIIMVFQNTSSAILVGFGFGGSLLALCSCGWVVAYSPRLPTSEPTWSERSNKGFPRTTPGTRPRSQTTSATTWATVPVWPLTCLRAMKSHWSHRSFSAWRPLLRSGLTQHWV